jgi:hypothetical protein
MLLQVGIGIHRKSLWITQWYASLFAGQSWKKLSEIRNGHKRTCQTCQAKRHPSKEIPSFHL